MGLLMRSELSEAWFLRSACLSVYPVVFQWLGPVRRADRSMIFFPAHTHDSCALFFAFLILFVQSLLTSKGMNFEDSVL